MTALDMLKCTVLTPNFNILFNDAIFDLGISRQHFRVLLISILILFMVDYRKYKGIDVVENFFTQHFWFRCLMEIALLFTVLLFGCYGELYDAASFIYFQF